MLFFLICLLLMAVQPAQSTQEVHAPDQRFGMTESFWLPEEARDLGVGWERILFYWREIQPAGPDDWNTLHVREEWLGQANSQGRMVVGLLKNTAPWASEDGTEAGVPKGLYLPVEDPANLWARFVEKVAKYYGPRNVHHWIIWNEPEISKGVYGHEFSGSINDYYQLLKVAYIVLKDTDPKATVHLAGVTWWHDQEYLRRLFELMANDSAAAKNNYFFDIISLHIYFRSESIRTIISSVRETEDQFGLDKPIWINETNAAPNLDPEWPVERPLFDVDLNQQAWFIVQAFSLAFAEGIERASVYKLVDIDLPPGGEPFGVIRTDLSRRPAYLAYKLMTTYLSGFSEVEIEEHPGYYRVSFQRPTGITHVLWTRKDSGVGVEIAAEMEHAKLIMLNGQTMNLSADAGSYIIELAGARCRGECIVGGPPVFVVELQNKDLHGVQNSTPTFQELRYERQLTWIYEDEKLGVSATATPVSNIIAQNDTPVPAQTREIAVAAVSTKPLVPSDVPTPVSEDILPTAKPEAIINETVSDENPTINALWILAIGAFFVAGVTVILRLDRKTN